jgi:hypothetical protein
MKDHHEKRNAKVNQIDLGSNELRRKLARAHTQSSALVPRLQGKTPKEGIAIAFAAQDDIGSRVDLVRNYRLV